MVCFPAQPSMRLLTVHEEKKICLFEGYLWLLVCVFRFGFSLEKRLMSVGQQMSHSIDKIELECFV
jgi:hypothetical protein